MVLSFLNKNKVSQSFDKAATHYEQWAVLQKEIGEQLVERLEALKIKPSRILDVGAGTGWLSRTLSRRHPKAQVYSVDISFKMSQQARKKAAGWFSKQRVICADAVQLPFTDRSIDLLLSNLMLQWCHDIQAVLSEFARVLKPEGALFFSTFGPDTLKELRQSWATVDNASHVNAFHDMQDIGDILLYAGFTHPVMDVDWLQYAYSDVKQLMMTLKKIGAHHLTEGRLPGLMGKNKFKALLAAYEQYRLPNGSLPATYEVVYGHAWGQKTVESSQARMIPIHLQK